MHKFTIFFTFFADGAIRRKYIELAIKPLLEQTDKTIPIIVVDSSSQIYSVQNKALFSGFSNLIYIHDTEKNPFKRCEKYLSLIKTDFVLRLLEDCVYINLFKNDLISIDNDIALMERKKDINVIQYPIINDQKFTIDGYKIFYPKNVVDKSDILEDAGYQYYDRSIERRIYHYLCNNVLYRTDFFIRHWRYIESTYDNHNSAESSKPNNKIFKFLFSRPYAWRIGSIFNRYYEKIFYSDSIIKNIYITETMFDSSVVHIGYYSTEAEYDQFGAGSERGASPSDNKGVTSVLNNLSVFSNTEFLDNVQFEEINE